MPRLTERAFCLFTVLSIYSSAPADAGVLTDHWSFGLKERHCCRRQPHFVFIGKDISHSPISVDIGKCGSQCGSSRRSANYSSEFFGFPKHLSVLEQLQTHKKQDSGQMLGDAGMLKSSLCPPDAVCQPVQLRVERFLLLDGIRELEVVETCQCNENPAGCVRSTLLKTYLPDSPLEVTVDVGRCSNPAIPGGLGCVPTKFESVVLENPNGLQLIQTVELCEVRENCYRLPHVEYYYAITINSRGEKEEGLKEVDVGRCLGVCTAGSGCLRRDSHNKDQCVAWGDGSSSGCSPREYEMHTIMSRHGKVRNIYAIKSCECHRTNS